MTHYDSAGKVEGMNQSATTPPTTKPKTDWDAVERDYRTGKFTLRELAALHNISHQAIQAKAKKQEWSQDLGEQIRQATNARLVASLVDNEVAKSGQTVANTVLVAAEMNTQVILGHRHGLNRITRIKAKLLDHIEQAVDNLPELAQIVEMVRNEGENGMDKANDALKKSLGRGAIVDDLKKLAEVDERVRKGEREAFSITSEVEEAASRQQRRVMIEFVDVVAK